MAEEVEESLVGADVEDPIYANIIHISNEYSAYMSRACTHCRSMVDSSMHKSGLRAPNTPTLNREKGGVRFHALATG